MKKNKTNSKNKETSMYVAEQLSKLSPADMEFEEFRDICYAIRSCGMAQETWTEWANQDKDNPRNKRCSEIWDSFNAEENTITFEYVTAQIEARKITEAKYYESKEFFGIFSKPIQQAIRKPSEIIAEEPDNNNYLIDGILKQSKKLLLIAPPKAGKTFFALNISLGIVSGTDILGLRCKQGEVLFVDCETGLREVAGRLYNIAEQRGIDKATCDKVRFYDPYINYRISPSDLLREISEQIEYGEYKLVVIDSFYCVFDGDENSAKDVAIFTRYVDEFIKKTGAAVLIVHHEGKSSSYKKSVVDRACGSNVFGRFFDGIISLSPNEKSNSPEGISETVEVSLRAYSPQEPIDVIYKNGLHFKEKDTA